MKISRVLKFLAISADELIAAVFLLLVLPEMGINIPLAVSAVILVALILKDLLVAPFVLGGGAEKRPEAGPESLIGRAATVVEDLAPEGLVKLAGELWTAECINGTAKKGESVRVVGVRGAKVLVELPASPEPSRPPRDSSS
ncbi:NfeD family protein [Thermococcus sp. M36]|nr:NfeD family protein [Thermococcus sp. M36]